MVRAGGTRAPGSPLAPPGCWSGQDKTPVTTNSSGLYQSSFPKRNWEVHPQDSYHDSSQDGDLINPLHVPCTEVPAPEKTSKETPWRNLTPLGRKAPCTPNHPSIPISHSPPPWWALCKS